MFSGIESLRCEDSNLSETLPQSFKPEFTSMREQSRVPVYFWLGRVVMASEGVRWARIPSK